MCTLTAAAILSGAASAASTFGQAQAASASAKVQKASADFNKQLALTEHGLSAGRLRQLEGQMLVGAAAGGIGGLSAPSLDAKLVEVAHARHENALKLAQGEHDFWRANANIAIDKYQSNVSTLSSVLKIAGTASQDIYQINNSQP